MDLPKYDKDRSSYIHKICQEPGCSNEFEGLKVTKYCNHHRDIRNRVKRPKVKEVVDNVMTFKHNFQESVEIEFKCSHPDCRNTYRLRVFHKHYVYPKYCEDHMAKHKRRAKV